MAIAINYFPFQENSHKKLTYKTYTVQLEGNSNLVKLS